MSDENATTLEIPVEEEDGRSPVSTNGEEAKPTPLPSVPRAWDRTSCAPTALAPLRSASCSRAVGAALSVLWWFESTPSAD